jgi:large repetitive protein
VTGGTDGPQFFASSEIFDPATNTFSPTGSMTMERTRAVAAPLPDGRVLVASGTLDEITVFPSSETYDPWTGGFSAEGMPLIGTPRFYAVSAPLPDGRVLIAGGIAEGTYLASAEVFVPDPGPLATTRSGAASATAHRCAKQKKKKRKKKRSCRA